MKISIMKDFSEYPKLRYCDLSDNSAEKFYHTLLNQKFYEAVSESEILEVDIDYTAGYTSSFLDEAFGNLVYDFTLEIVKKYLVIISVDEPYWLTMINNQTFKEWEDRRINKRMPKKTIRHAPWYRYINGLFEKKNWIDVSN